MFASLVLLTAACLAMPSMAGQDGDDANRKSRELTEQSKSVLVEAGEAEDNDDYASACSKYSDGAELLERAIYASLPMMLDSDYDSAEVERHNDELQKIVNMAKEGAKRSCALAKQ
jgi:hypothetical protein